MGDYYVGVNNLINCMDKLLRIRITEKTKKKIEKIAEKRKLTQITVLEYLLSNRIDLKELNKIII